MSRGFRERIAVSLLGAAVLMAAVLGVMTIRSYTQPASTAMVQQGDVSGAQSGASPAAMPNAPGSTQTSGGGSGGVSGGENTNGGLLCPPRAGGSSGRAGPPRGIIQTDQPG